MRTGVSLAIAAFLISPAIAQDTELPVHACADAVGTFLTRSFPRDEGGEKMLSRSLIALTNGGHVIFVDSGEAGERGYAPFSNGLGRWRCLSEEGEPSRFSGTYLQFTFPTTGEQQVTRLNFNGTYDRAVETLNLSVTLYFVPLDGDPLNAQALKNGRVFDLTGKKVMAR